MSDGASPGVTERLVVKFGVGFISGLFVGGLFGAVLSGGRFGTTVGGGVGTGVALGALAALVRDESYRKLHKWPWPWRGC
jgi:hypothetical protein